MEADEEFDGVPVVLNYYVWIGIGLVFATVACGSLIAVITDSRLLGWVVGVVAGAVFGPILGDYAHRDQRRARARYYEAQFRKMDK